MAFLLKLILKLFKVVFLVFMFLVPKTVFAQEWTKMGTLPELSFTVLEVIDGTMYAATFNQLFISHDSGETWQQSVFIDNEDVIPTCITKFNDKLYIGTSWEVIFSSPINQADQMWSNEINNILWVTSFAEKDGTLYAATMGDGILKQTSDGSWIFFNDSLPDYSTSVNKIVATPQSLLAAAGINGTFYRYNFAQNKWEEEYYFGAISAGFDIEDMVYVENTLYASRRNLLLRSTNDGVGWATHQQGLINGLGRVLYLGKNHIYTITTGATDTDNISWIHRKIPNSEENWEIYADNLPFHVFTIREKGNKIFATAHNGIYFRVDENLYTDIPNVATFSVYPNPSNGNFSVEINDHPIRTLKLFDLKGRLIWTKENILSDFEFCIEEKGFYILTANETSYKLVVK